MFQSQYGKNDSSICRNSTSRAARRPSANEELDSDAESFFMDHKALAAGKFTSTKPRSMKDFFKPHPSSALDHGENEGSDSDQSVDY